MSKLAFLFPGQGSQRVGMGSDLRTNRPEVFDKYMNLAQAASGLPIGQYCLEGPEETLARTDVTQPALFALSLALTEIAREIGLSPDFVAGHSLGEYTAAVASGALDAEAGMALVARRGKLMNEAQSERPGSMAAVIGLPSEQLADLCQKASETGLVRLANLNTPTQIVVSGEAAGVDALMELAKSAGAERVVKLQVGAAFHSPLMEPVQKKMAEAMADVAWNEPKTAMASNASGQLVSSADGVREALIAQIASPVQWVSCVQQLRSAGATSFIEIGSGRVLTGLVRQIDQEFEGQAVDTPAKIAKFAEAATTGRTS